MVSVVDPYTNTNRRRNFSSLEIKERTYYRYFLDFQIFVLFCYTTNYKHEFI